MGSRIIQMTNMGIKMVANVEDNELYKAVLGPKKEGEENTNSTVWRPNEK